MAERQQAQALLTPFQRLTVELPMQDCKRLRLAVAADDPLEIELGETLPTNPEDDENSNSMMSANSEKEGLGAQMVLEQNLGNTYSP